MASYFEKSSYLVAAMAAPVVAMLVWVGVISLRALKAPTFMVPVEGFDPRDLLSGHYLRYRIRLESPCNTDSPKEKNTCACFTGNSVVVESCKTRRCASYVSGQCVAGGFVSESLQRYFIPESLRGSLPVVPPMATLRVKVGSGWAEAEQMFVDGIEIEKWAKK